MCIPNSTEVNFFVYGGAIWFMNAELLSFPIWKSHSASFPFTDFCLVETIENAMGTASHHYEQNDIQLFVITVLTCPGRNFPLHQIKYDAEKRSSLSSLSIIIIDFNVGANIASFLKHAGRTFHVFVVVVV